MKYNLYISAASCLRQERTNKSIQMTQNFSLQRKNGNDIGLRNMSRANTSDDITNFCQPRCNKQSICTQ